MQKPTMALILALPALGACGSNNETAEVSGFASAAVDTPVALTQITRPDADTIRAAVDTTGGYNLTNARAGNVEGEEIRRINTSASIPDGFGDAAVFQTDNVTVAAGFDIGGQPNFAAISGATEALPTGDATYAGHYTAVTGNNTNEHGALTLLYNFADGSIAGTSNDTQLVVAGSTNANGEISGDVTFDGTQAPLSGGIYGSNAEDLAAGFSNANVGGYIYGARQAPAAP